MISKHARTVKKQLELFASDPGERFRPVYTPQILDDGIIELVQTGVEDVQALINADKDSCDINLLVQRFANGDVTALNRANPMFMDLVGTPKTMAEAFAIQQRAEAAFDGLPSEIRKKFDMNFYKFLSAAGTKEWFDALKVDTEVKADES